MMFFITILVFLSFSLINLFLLWQFLKSFLGWANAKSIDEQKRYTFQVALWGSFKLIFIGLFIVLLLKGQKFDIKGILIGMSALILFPVIGGFVWSFMKRKEV